MTAGGMICGAVLTFATGFLTGVVTDIIRTRRKQETRLAETMQRLRAVAHELKDEHDGAVAIARIQELDALISELTRLPCRGESEVREWTRSWGFARNVCSALRAAQASEAPDASKLLASIRGLAGRYLQEQDAQ